VDAVGLTSFLPASGNNWGTAFTIEGYVPAEGAGLNLAATSLVENDPFEALGIRVLRGRVFTESDNAGSQLVAIVNRKMAERGIPCWRCEANRKMPTIFGKPRLRSTGKRDYRRKQRATH